VTDRQADRRAEGFTIASTALCIASYADALSKTKARSVVHGLGELEQSLVNACLVLFKVSFCDMN